MTRGEVAARQAVACNEILEPASLLAIDHEDSCGGDLCSCNGTAWFRGLTMIVGVDSDHVAEAFWLM